MPIIREARLEDLEALVALLHLLFAIEADFSFDAARQRQGLQLLLNSGQGCVLAAVEAGQVVGMCTGQLVLSTAEGGVSVLVEDMVVQPDHRRQGTGRALMAAMVGWALERGATRLQLLADRNNPPALAFYERLGWRITNMICLRHHV